MRKIFNLFFLLLLPVQLLLGTEVKPWTRVDLELYPRLDYLYQHYSKIHTSSGSESRNSNDHFVTAGVSGSYAEWSAELELTFADTRHRSFGFDHFRATGRYQWMSDIIGDPLSVITGISYIAVMQTALDDISSFHHGRNEVEVFLSIGKERSCWNTWSSRWWGVAFFGVADHGSPWWRAIAGWEKNFCENYYFEMFVRGLLGMGGESLDLDESFSGYGPIRHRSVDVGASITKNSFCGGIWIAEFTQRVYACNYPSAASLLKISYIYPFGL